MNAPNRVIERDANWLQGVGRDGEIVAAARRKSKGTLWYVSLRQHLSDQVTSRNQTPHARISGKLPEEVQRKMIRAILETA